MIKKFLFSLLLATRVTRLVAWLNRKKVPILCYHSITRQPEPKLNDPYKLNVPIDSFLRQLDYLQAHYQIISLAEFVRAQHENIKLPPRAAVLTFDDGVRNFFTVVAPLLLERGIPATAFIVTGEDFTRGGSDLNVNWCIDDDEIFLSWSEVQLLAKQGIEFGSHTCTHLALPDISLSQARSELEGSLDALQTNLGPKMFALSYPHGRTSPSISRLSRSVGYTCAVTTSLGPNDRECDLFALRRTGIASDDDLATFAARVSGLTFWYGRALEFLYMRRLPTSQSSTFSYDQIIPEEYNSNESY